MKGRYVHTQLAAVAALLAATAVEATPCADGIGPQAAVAGYLKAMQEHRFGDAYAFVSKTMTDGKVREEWAALQKLFYEGGEVNILGFDVRTPHGTDTDAACSATAQVPNVLNSRDKFNNQGTTEFEIYTVVRQGEAWKVDSQDTLYDAAAIERWFPGAEIPKFRDQY